MSNYPAGVTGWEPQIAGPEFESEKMEQMACDEECGFDGEVPVTEVSYRGDYMVSVYWTCPRCNRSHDFEYEDAPDFSDYYDYDYEYDYEEAL